MEKSPLREGASTSVNVTVGRRSREYLTEREVERLIEAAKQNRSGHRDATAILVAYRHGLRASEVVVLRWDDIDLATGRLHLRRAKGGDASVHPISARESRALRKLLREADQGHGSRPDLASVLQDGGQSANMYIRSGAIWEISAKYPFTHEMKTLLAGLILIHSWYPNECCADKDCHPVPCDEISEGDNGAMHWKNLIFEGSQIRTSPDSECHVCHLSEEGRPVIPICIFTQKKPSA